MNSYRGTVEFRSNIRVMFPVEVKANSWPVAVNRAAKAGLKLYKENRKGKRVKVTGVIVDIIKHNSFVEEPFNDI